MGKKSALGKRGRRMGIRIIARVECRSEASAEQRPVAVWQAGERIPVAEVIEDSVEGAVQAGEPAVRRLRVRLADCQLVELRRELPRGDWRVFRPATEG